MACYQLVAKRNQRDQEAVEDEGPPPNLLEKIGLDLSLAEWNVYQIQCLKVSILICKKHAEISNKFFVFYFGTESYIF